MGIFKENYKKNFLSNDVLNNLDLRCLFAVHWPLYVVYLRNDSPTSWLSLSNSLNAFFKIAIPASCNTDRRSELLTAVAKSASLYPDNVSCRFRVAVSMLLSIRPKSSLYNWRRLISFKTVVRAV